MSLMRWHATPTTALTLLFVQVRGAHCQQASIKGFKVRHTELHARGPLRASWGARQGCRGCTSLMRKSRPILPTARCHSSRLSAPWRTAPLAPFTCMRIPCSLTLLLHVIEQYLLTQQSLQKPVLPDCATGNSQVAFNSCVSQHQAPVSAHIGPLWLWRQNNG